MIFPAPAGLVVDHINGNRMDNRRCNLRHCTNAENSRNCQHRSGTSKYRGVYYAKQTKKWRASIMHNGKRFHLGYFATEEAAAEKWNEAAKAMFGEYVVLNVTEKSLVALI